MQIYVGPWFALLTPICAASLFGVLQPPSAAGSAGAAVLMRALEPLGEFDARRRERGHSRPTRGSRPVRRVGRQAVPVSNSVDEDEVS